MGVKKRKGRQPKSDATTIPGAVTSSPASRMATKWRPTVRFCIVTAIFQTVLAVVVQLVLPEVVTQPEGSSGGFSARQVVDTGSNGMKYEERTALARRYFEAAASFDGSRGEGHKGWLYLLAAHSYATNPEILDNLVNNYLGANYWYLAIDEIRNVQEGMPQLKEFADRLENTVRQSVSGFDAKMKDYERFTRQPEAATMAYQLKQPEVLLPFSTAVSSFRLIEQFPKLQRLNEEFYNAVVRSYEALRKVDGNEKLTETELNHRYFRWQMDQLRQTGDYWTGFTKLDLFKDLIDTMREAAVKVLRLHGLSERQARRKANHDIIFWASVHTGNSVHEPHMTEDSLLGGVYYVSVPPYSGNLELFDPRSGFQTVCPNTVEHLVNPPFHRTVHIQPEEGLLVIFPGWLVHGVRASTGLDTAKHKFRVSISVNLKGEWQDTTSLRFLLQ